MEPRIRKRRAWPYLLAVVLLLILIVLVGRSCRQDAGYGPPVMSDTLETDTLGTMPPPTDAGEATPSDTMPRDTLANPPLTPPGVTPGTPVTPGMPAVAPGSP